MGDHAENWIERFTAQNSRPPRILHMGNICNNAYQTAKMLNAVGADCDVLNGDDYYVMTHPEWDDADFEGDVGNTYFPAFHKLDLHGFVRPRWYAQAPFNLAIDYLLAKREGDAARTARLWKKMERARRYLSVRESGTPWGNLLKRAEWVKNTVPSAILAKVDYLGQVLAELFTRPGTFVKRVRMKLGKLDAAEAARLLQSDRDAQAVRHKAMLNKVMDWDALARVQRDAEALFPDRDIHFDTELTSFMLHLPRLKRLFGHYDVIQAYANQPLWPYLCGWQDYVAYEHGTLRDYIYEEHDFARLNLLAFANAGAIYVTNMDCYDSAVYIAGQKNVPVVCGLHGFDTERIFENQQRALDGAYDRTRFAQPDQMLLFCPARVDIDPHYGTYLKKNDMLYRALGRLYQEHPGRFKVLQLDWGHDTKALKAFIHAECPGLEEAVIWHPPFQKKEYYQILQVADAVFDNFLLQLMGGNGIETLMSGHAVLVNKRIPQELMLRFFPEMWPVLAVDNEADIYTAAKTVVEDPKALADMARRGQQWILAHHSPRCIVEKNLATYQLVYPLP